MKRHNKLRPDEQQEDTEWLTLFTDINTSIFIQIIYLFTVLTCNVTEAVPLIATITSHDLSYIIV